MPKELFQVKWINFMEFLLFTKKIREIEIFFLNLMSLFFAWTFF